MSMRQLARTKLASRWRRQAVPPATRTLTRRMPMRRSQSHPPLPLAVLDTTRVCVRRCLVDWCVDTHSCDVLVRAPEPHLTPGNDARRTCGHTRTSCSCRCSKYVVVQLPSNRVACDGSRVAVTFFAGFKQRAACRSFHICASNGGTRVPHLHSIGSRTVVRW